MRGMPSLDSSVRIRYVKDADEANFGRRIFSLECIHSLWGGLDLLSR